MVIATALLAVLVSSPVHAQSSDSSGRVTYISYTSPELNLDSRKIDGASLVLRDKASGKLVQIQLEEDEPDSGKFGGQFSVSMNDQSAPEVYVPPKNLRLTDKDNAKLYEMIRSGKLARRPTVWIKNDKGQSVLGVYETKELAEAALKAYEDEQKLARDMKRKKSGKNVNAEGALVTARALEQKNAMNALALEATKRAADRAQMELLEKQRAEERERKAKAMTEAERVQRRAKARDVSAEALAFYDKGDYKSAEDKFKEAINLDPENKDYYYKYGVTLYRNQKFNDALVVLNMTKVDPSTELERKYFIGLVHYRLKEYDAALASFNSVAGSDDKTMGPSSLFYVGIILFSQEKYEPAKAAFEKVIDTSSDVNLDKQSEDYLDRIASAMIFQKMRENKFTLMAVVGAMYDSNVLLSPDGSTSTSTNISDARLLTIFDLQYRPIYNEKHEWSPHGTVNLTNSSKNTAAIADPFVYTLAAPYTYKGAMGKTPLRLSMTPGYELLYLDPHSTGKKVLEQRSSYVSVDSTFVVNPTWFSTYTLEYRRDDSTDESSQGIDNLDSNKYTLRTTQVKMLDKKRMLMPTIAYVRNAAAGSDKTYGRYDLGITYVAPFWTDSTWNAGLAYYNMKYADALTPRTDNNYTASAGWSKPIREWLTWGVTGTYTKNGSNITANAYTKYMVITTATMITNF